MKQASSLERMDERLQRLREAGIHFVGEDIPRDYSTKRKTKAQAEAEVARQQRHDKMKAREIEQINNALEPNYAFRIEWENHDPKEPCPKCKGRLLHDKRCEHMLKCKSCGWRGNRWLLTL